MRRILRCLPLPMIAAAAMAAAPAASAGTSESTNWAGYAIHRSGVRFDKVLGTWIEPQPTCSAHEPTYSSIWVGIGGYDLSSEALEQIGTDADCSASGRVSSSAWYELVPAPSRAIKLRVSPGDRIRAAVSIAGQRVTLTLRDLTRHRSFAETLRAAKLDATSAEWIVEAPSLCSNRFTCRTLPLADFDAASFTAVAARTTQGHTGTIEDRRWTKTRIRLAEAGRRFIAGATAADFATATPSPLTAGGSAFTVTYKGAAYGVAPAEVTRVAGARLVHAGWSGRPLRPPSAGRS